MDYNEVFTTIEQMKNSGVDLNTVMAATQSLLDTGKTPLGLNQWKLTDKPRMEEFNEDNRIIDEQLSKKANVTRAIEYDIPYIGNIKKARASYFTKDEMGIVRVHLSATTTDSSNIVSGTVVATLPEGFRPKEQIEFPATMRLSTNATGTCICQTNGNINLYSSVNTSSFVCVCIFQSQ